MIHLLFRKAHGSQHGPDTILTEAELTRAGVHCQDDTWIALRDDGIVDWANGEWHLTKTTRAFLRHYLVAKKPTDKVDIRVDYPEAFIVMPFGEPWSRDVYDRMFVPGIKGAGFEAVRGDQVPRIGNLNDNVWSSITQAGVIVADISVPNPNVYYEIGLATVLGKPVFACTQKGTTLAADLRGVHYYEYDLNDLAAGAISLTDALVKWAGKADHQPMGVKEVEDGTFTRTAAGQAAV